MKRRVRMLGAIALLLGAARGGDAQGPAGPPESPAGLAPAVAVVGQLRIGHGELEEHTRHALRLYRERNRVDMDPQLEPIVRRQVLENLIRQRLLMLEAGRRGVTVSEAEVEAQMRLDPAFQVGGTFNEAKFLAVKATNPEAFARARAATRDALAARKAGERMERETRPDDTAIRAQLERELGRATVEYLALRSGDFDGGYPEPREADLIAHHAANAERYRRPEEASLSVILVHRPAVGDSVGATDAGYRAWEQRMRVRADSLLAAHRAGAAFEELAHQHGGVKRRISLRRDRLPDFWRGSPQEAAAVFAARPGTVLPVPVRAAPGWAVVRVDAIIPSHVAPLRSVAREIRRELRAAAMAREENRLRHVIYAALRDSLRGEAYRVRYAVADTASFAPGEPTAGELERFYRALLADYSSYDRESGMVVETPFAQVRDEVRRRWMRERRRDLARTAAQRLHETWSRGRRNPGLERAMSLVREIGPVPASSLAGGSGADVALGQALAARGEETGVGMTSFAGGHVVFDVLERVRDHVPTFEQATTLLTPLVQATRAEEEEEGARKLFDADPSAFRSRSIVNFNRLIIELPSLLKVELSREEVERFYRANINRFSVHELARVRHILISPSGPGDAADAEARAKAERILARVRAGEDFARLAAEFSEDPATRYNGGDVGVFRRGQMREAFERAAFSMRLGDIAGPVRTEVGYHVMESLEYQPPIVHPIEEVYANVAHACAVKKAQRIATERADSLFRTLKSVAHAKAVAARHSLDVIPNSHEIGSYGGFDGILLPYIKKVETLKPGELYPGTQLYEGLGQVITWVDTIIPARSLAWEEARDRVVERYRWERSLAALGAKQAELDSMLGAGWSFDSLATLFGGFERLEDAPPGSELRGMRGRRLLDSLVFGLERDAVLEPGKPSGWIGFPGGQAMIRVTERIGPDPEELARRIELRRQRVLWRNLNEYFGRLKARYPVEILDGELRATNLAEPTES